MDFLLRFKILEWLSSIAQYTFLNLLELYLTALNNIGFEHLKFNILHWEKKLQHGETALLIISPVGKETVTALL